MGNRADMYRRAGDLIEALQSIDKMYYVVIENGKILIAQDTETWSPKLQVWPEED